MENGHGICLSSDTACSSLGSHHNGYIILARVQRDGSINYMIINQPSGDLLSINFTFEN